MKRSLHPSRYRPCFASAKRPAEQCSAIDITKPPWETLVEGRRISLSQRWLAAPVTPFGSLAGTPIRDAPLITGKRVYRR